MRKALKLGLLVTTGALALVGLSMTACGSDSSGSEFDDERFGEAPGDKSGKLGDGKCEGIACQQVVCPDPNVTTTVSGIVTAPNGTLPLYNAIVYVPQQPLDPMPEGASCDRCGNVSGKPLVSAVTGADGKFVLENVPVGKDIPLVVQVGKWRREVRLPNVAQCVDNPIADRNVTRLPRNKGEGHLPKIAVTTGRCDQLACLLPKLGIDASEYTPSTGDGRLHIYRGATHSNVPAPAPSGSLDATDLWSNTASLKKYDMVMLSCECGEHNETKPNAAKNAMYEFASLGGRVFASHYHYAWTQTGPLRDTAQWLGGSDSSDSTGPFYVDTDFPKGAALADWLVNVQATTKHGEIPISQPRQDVGVVVAPTQRWVYEKRWVVPGVIEDPIIPQATKYLSVNTPVSKPVEEQCGKFVFADMHLYGLDVQPPDSTALPNDGFPGTCSKDLTPEEKALAFLFFDLSSCVQDDKQPPAPPVK